MTTEVVKAKPISRDRVVGSRPIHVHRPPSGAETWLCNSPYCEELATEHPDDGGFEPIVQGREPWRGRQ